MMKAIWAGVAATIMLTSSAALADPPSWAPAHGRRAHEANRVYDSGIYDRDGRYRTPHRLSRNDRIWRGDDGRYYCHRSNGTTGLVVGAAVGGLIGNRVASGDRTLGTIIGAVGGGLLGREIDRGHVSCR